MRNIPKAKEIKAMKLLQKAYAKINLTLEILGTRRGDGFHDIAPVMMNVPTLYDGVTLSA